MIFMFLTTGCSQNFNSELFKTTYSKEETSSALNYAISRQGRPYQWGGNGPNEFDCSGLVIWAYRQVNNDLILRISDFYSRDATMDDIYRYNIKKIHPTELEAGDIVFFTNNENRITHGGLFIEWLDNNSFRYIHASSTGKEVRKDNWHLNEEYYHWFAGAGKLIYHER